MTTINVFNPAKGNKWLYVEMVRQQRTDGELEIGRNGMEYVLGILTHLNNASGKTFVADSTVAKQAGYAGNSHDFKGVRKAMVEGGFLHVWGKKGRAYNVSLLVPPHLHEEYEELHLSTRRVQVEAGSSHGGELTRNSVLVTPDSVPGSLDPGPATQDAGLVTLDAEPSGERLGHVPDLAACSGTWNGCDHAECVALRNQSESKAKRTLRRFAA